MLKIWINRYGSMKFAHIEIHTIQVLHFNDVLHPMCFVSEPSPKICISIKLCFHTQILNIGYWSQLQPFRYRYHYYLTVVIVTGTFVWLFFFCVAHVVHGRLLCKHISFLRPPNEMSFQDILATDVNFDLCGINMFSLALSLSFSPEGLIYIGS